MKKLLLILLLFSTGLSAGVRVGTIAFYKFENNGLDQSPSGYTLTTVGTVPYAAGGPAGGAYQAGVFSDDNYFTTPANFNTAYSGLSAWTVEFYVSPVSFGAGQEPVVWYHTDSGTAFFQILNGGAVKYQRLTTRTGSAQSAAGQVVAGTVYYFAITFDGTTLKVNKAEVTGGVVGAFSVVASSVFDASTGTVSLTAIGRYQSAASFYLDGYVDNLRVSNKALTSFPTTDPNVNRSMYLEDVFYFNISKFLKMISTPLYATTQNQFVEQQRANETIRIAKMQRQRLPIPTATLTPTRARMSHTPTPTPTPRVR